MSNQFHRLKATQSCTALLLSLAVAGCASGPRTVTRPDVSRALLTFADEFEGTQLQSSLWNVVSRNIYYPGVLSAHNPDMVSVQNGHLRIAVEDIPYLSMPYSGGEIDTKLKFSQQYGYFEARIKMPKGPGLHGAFWLWPASEKWPPEIDIVEAKGDQPTRAFMTVHWAENGVVRSHPQQVDFSGDHFAEAHFEGPDFTQDFHIFGLEWTPRALIWYVDGTERHRTTRHVPHEPFVFVIDLAVDSYGGAINNSTVLPAAMLVDYVRAYRMADDSSPTPSRHTSSD